MKICNLRLATIMGSVLALAACAETPLGPRVQMIPPAGKTFEQFSNEKQYCQQAAANDVHGQASHQNKRAILGSVLTTALGAGLGGAIGGGAGAGIGAAAGAVGGGASGAGFSERQQVGIQEQYDQTYRACMVSYGNKMTGDAVIVRSTSENSAYAQ